MADADSDPDAAAGGTYTLLIDLSSPADVEFGAAGERALPAGRYAYTGSALGPGGFARIERHRRVAAGESDVRHWHVDYLLGRGEAEVAGAVRSPGSDAECSTARAVAGDDAVEVVPGVGATDCDCPGHLAFAENGVVLYRTVERVHGRSEARNE